MRYRDRYLFDLQGYLTIPEALSAPAVAELNEVVDGMARREMGSEETSHRWLRLLARALPFAISSTIHRSCRSSRNCSERSSGLITNTSMSSVREWGPIGAGLHGGAVPFRPIEYYWSGDGQMHSGLVSVAYNLKDVGADDGGFACVPGSHKSAFAFPDRWKDLSDPHPCVRRVTGAAGSAIIFTEALVHGTLPVAGDEERRTAFYKYSPRTLAWSRTLYDPGDYPDLTPRRATSSGLRVWSTWKIDRGPFESEGTRHHHVHRRGAAARPEGYRVGRRWPTSLECCPPARRESGLGESVERGGPRSNADD